MRNYDNSSKVEATAIQKTKKKAIYTPTEKLKVIEVSDFPSLGKLTALRFVEWMIKNPEGVVSLPTGKTPEHFIKWTNHYLSNWSKAEVKKDLESWGIDTSKKPDISSFTFVQIDEFYPLNPSQENSFAYYIHKFYFKEFGLDAKKAILIDTWVNGAPEGKNLGSVFGNNKVDLSLRFRQPVTEADRLQYNAITAADQFSMEYEEKISKAGGIGFFLGGIGPDGHIGFNIRGSDHFSTTRLIPINYETAAAAATDLGGIEISRQKVVITIGLKTITTNPTATAIIIAAGESKAKVVKDAVENTPSVLYPATALQNLKGAAFYITHGAAARLTERRLENLKAYGNNIPLEAKEKILIDVAYKNKKRLIELETEDLAADKLGNHLLKHDRDILDTAAKIACDIKEKMLKGSENLSDQVILHTAPHHDDIMLGYLPYILHLVRNPKNEHYFATLTSGFTSVTSSYILSIMNNLEKKLINKEFGELLSKGYFAKDNQASRNRDIYQYLDGVAANKKEMQVEGETRRLLRNLMELTEKTTPVEILKEIKKLNDYFSTSYPGKKDSPLVQKLKGTVREWEEELTWGHLGFSCDHIFHLRLGFYTGDIFTQNPEVERDVQPTLELLRKTKPTIVTVAFDPEASGPDTHYKILQTIAEALKIYLNEDKTRKVTVWGYRNVWFRFHPSEADIFVPVSMNSLAIMRTAFIDCFGSQRSASFPSYEYDGPFSDLAQKIMVEQYSVIKTCLGRDFFLSHPVARTRATRGMVFLKSMTPKEFFTHAQSLKKLTE